MKKYTPNSQHPFDINNINNTALIYFFFFCIFRVIFCFKRKSNNK